MIDVLSTAFEKVDKVFKELEMLEKQISEASEDMAKLLNKYAESL